MKKKSCGVDVKVCGGSRSNIKSNLKMKATSN
jgi:hypothetical protein